MTQKAAAAQRQLAAALSADALLDPLHGLLSLYGSMKDLSNIPKKRFRRPPAQNCLGNLAGLASRKPT
jgi:hypothetical protein